jgi:hypothetical protein
MRPVEKRQQRSDRRAHGEGEGSERRERTAGMSDTILIRKCDGCGKVTAFDMNATVKHKREMQFMGQTVYEVPKSEIASHRANMGSCKCGKKGRQS